MLTGLPEGFNALDPRFETGELPGGHVVRIARIDYQRPVGGQVYVEDSVSVEVYGYKRVEDRFEHLDLLVSQGYEWTFVEINGKRVARYHDSGVDGRVWVSGPYLFVVFSGLDKSQSGPWVDEFAQLYMEPPPKPTPTATAPQPTATPTPWTIPIGTGANYRAVHMGGNWGITKDAVHELPPEYFEYLRDLNVDWVGISVALHVEDSMDSTVDSRYEGEFINTFTDEVLVSVIRAFRKHGFNVYLALAFESGAGAERPVQRWQLGDPTAHEYDSNVLPEYWPWRTDHPDHQRFVAEFWETYTEQAVHFAEIAEAEGVGLYCIGTETDRLFRSRSGGVWPNHFGSEMTAMVEAVRSAYSGLLGYEMHWGAVADRGYFGPGSDHLFEDLGLDVVGVSAYFELAESPPTQVLSVQDLEPKWEAIFQEHLIPLQNRNPGKPIVFTEFGYVDSVGSPNMASMDEFVNKVFKDKNGNSLDDGEETQSNCYETFFDAMDRHPGVVQGAFLWDTMMGTQQQWQQAFGSLRNFSVRDKLVEDIVRTRYEQWR